jgi:hypothetical protein
MTVKNVKALVGALFLETLAFAIYYLADHIKKISPKYIYLGPEGFKPAQANPRGTLD